MENIDFEIGSEGREDILRNVWTLHDARWFIKTIGKYGLDAANELNRTVIRSMGKTEIKVLMNGSGIKKITDIDRLNSLMTVASKLFFPKEHKYEFKILNENELLGHVIECYVHKNVKKAGIADLYKCAARPRFESWIAAMGLNGEIVQEVDSSNCNGTCGIVFRIDW
ncbi:MAG: hypothetical protein JW984_15460 [Deltaproteobacteria bacterium]|uniref:Uncharacterized protein n=1 Tax=Candidatus Zymogenus saltonus TaxID=2844893 RepID=A0A9D8PPV8_9DELT|nr:hypothetical protein [Candidatus Zymogenus saltonus]